MLEEVELFVAGGCPEVWAFVVLFLFGDAVLVVDGDAALASEGWVG